MRLVLQEVLDLLVKEGVTEIPIGSLAVRVEQFLPGKGISTAFHIIHRFGHTIPGWKLIRNDRHVQVLRRSL
jgi:hypothetical protein